MSESHKWYAVRTRSKCEKMVALTFRDKGIEQYLPIFREVHQWKDRRKTVELPLFPGYLFARLVSSRPAQLPVLRTEGVVGILGRPDMFEPIPDHEIEGVRQLVATSVGFCAHPLLQEGSWVQVKRGALKGVEGLLVRVKNQSRLVLSISLLSRSISTEIDLSDVQLIQPFISRKVA